MEKLTKKKSNRIMTLSERVWRKRRGTGFGQPCLKNEEI